MKTPFLWIVIAGLLAVIVYLMSQPTSNVVVVEEPAFRYGYWRDDWAYTRPWGVGGYSWRDHHHRPHFGGGWGGGHPHKFQGKK